MSSLSGFSESTRSVSSSAREKSRVSEGLPNVSEKVFGSGQDESFEQPNMAGMFPSELARVTFPVALGMSGRALWSLIGFLDIGGRLW